MAVEPDSDPDVALLQRIVVRDTAAVAKLYDRRSTLLFGVIMRILRNRSDAEDVTHSELAARFQLPLGTVKTRIRKRHAGHARADGALRMIPDDVEALALADIAGALDPDEQLELQVRVAALSPDVRRQVARLYDTTTALAASTDLRPSPGVRDRLMASLASPAKYTVSAEDGQWAESGLPGIRIKILAVDHQRGLATLLLRGDPGARYPAHHHSAPEECYVVRGSVIIGGRLLRAGDFHHADAGSDHGDISTIEGAEVLLVGAIDDYLPGTSRQQTLR